MAATASSLLRLLAPTVFLLLWAAGFSVAAIGLEMASPLVLLVWRFGLATALLLPAMLLIRPPLPKHRGQWLHQLTLGVLIQVLYFGCAWYAISLGVSVSVLALIVSLQPLTVAFLSSRIERAPLSGRLVAGLLLGFVGTLLVIVARAQSIGIPSISGLLLCVVALAAMTSAALFEHFHRPNSGRGLPTAERRHPLVDNTIQYATAFLILAPLVGMSHDLSLNWNPTLVAVLAYLVLGNSIIAISLLLWMIRQGDATRVSALFYLVPPLAALIAWALLGETLPLLAWPGIALAAFGVWLARRQTAPKTPPSAGPQADSR